MWKVHMDEKNALEEIAFIKKVIQNSRRTVIMHGKEYIAWGIITSIGFIMTYFFNILKFRINYTLFWLIVIGTGYLINFFFIIKEKRSYKQANFSQKLLSYVWASCGIAMCICGFVGSYSGGIHYNSISPVLCTIVGIANLLTGVILDNKYVKFASIAWWISSIIMFLIPGYYIMLLMALLMITCQIIPGIFIYRNYKKEIAP
jgi:hypothetical protein